MKCRHVAFATLVLAVGHAGPAHAQRTDLGHISFENSGALEAQGPFIDGVLLLHSFEYEDAAEAFRRAQKIDTGFALAYWGEAMTYDHAVWMQQDSDAARAALARLAPTPEARRARAGTEREARYLDAVEILYGDGSKEDRDDRYSDGMRRLHEDYPDDDEAAVFYALALLGTAHEGRDFTTYMLAASIAEPVFEANPDHPGAAHMLIHSFDDPIHAPLGLPAARAYSRIAPGAAHAQHMTSHIFLARGMWKEVVAANEIARGVQNERLERLGRRPNVCGHYTSWLEYGYLQEGRVEDATSVLASCADRIGAEPSGSEIGYYGSMMLMYAVDTADWGTLERLRRDVPASQTATRLSWMDGFQAVEEGRADDAAAILSSLEAGGGDSGDEDRALRLELEGSIALLAGRDDDGIAILREAADLEASLPLEYGPPRIAWPTYEALADGLARAGRVDEAIAAYRTQLGRTPGRARSLAGLADAEAAAPQAGN